MNKKKIPTIKELRKICQSSVINEDSPVHVRIERKLSIYATSLFLHTPITANQLTVSWGIMIFIADLLFVYGNYWYSIIAAILLLCAGFLDHVDGEIARFRKNTSKIGVYFDFLFPTIGMPLIFIGLSFGSYNIFGDVRIFILGFLAALSMLWVELICNYGGREGGLRKLLLKDKRISNFQKVKKIILSIPGGLFSLEVIALLILICAVFNYSYIAIVFYGLVFPLYVILISVYKTKQIRRI